MKILTSILKMIITIMLLPILILTYYWWGYDYYRHVIN